MRDKWHYTHGEKVYGPASGKQLWQQIATGQMDLDDLIWPAGMGMSSAVRAEAVLAFQTRARETTTNAPSLPAPEWLPELALALAAVKDLTALPPPPPQAWIPDVSSAEETAHSHDRNPPPRQ